MDLGKVNIISLCTVERKRGEEIHYRSMKVIIVEGKKQRGYGVWKGYKDE